MRLDIESLRTFRAVVDAASITQAAYQTLPAPGKFKICIDTTNLL